VMQWQETNPMFGFRGCRLSIVYPEITEMQVKAIIGTSFKMLRRSFCLIMQSVLSTCMPIGATMDARKDIDVPMFRETTPRILVPFCFSEHELSAVAAAMSAACDCVCTDAWVRTGFGLPYVDCMLGASLDTPMACFRSDRLAGVLRVSFVSFDCDSLTRLVLGMTMDDSSTLMVQQNMTPLNSLPSD